MAWPTEAEFITALQTCGHPTHAGNLHDMGIVDSYFLDFSENKITVKILYPEDEVVPDLDVIDAITQPPSPSWIHDLWGAVNDLNSGAEIILEVDDAGRFWTVP